MTNTQQTTIDVAELAMKLYPFSNSERNAFIDGYNKAKETQKYTEKYLMNLVQKSHEIYNEGLGVATDAKKQKLIDFIQSLKPIETFGGNNKQQ